MRVEGNEAPTPSWTDAGRGNAVKRVVLLGPGGDGTFAAKRMKLPWKTIRSVGLLIALGCGAAGFAHAQSKEASRAKPATKPAADANAIFQPAFTVEGRQLQAGTAFLVKLASGPVLLVTAHHLFGPDGGWTRDLTWQELPKLVTGVRATSVGGASVTGQNALSMEGTATFHGNPAGGDVAAFKIAQTGTATVLSLAPAAPKVGDRIFLLATVGSDKLLRHAATVKQVGPQFVVYKFDDALELRATSGAALVDTENRVVAINLGGGGKPVVGFGNPVHAFGPKLERAAAAR